MSEMDYLELLIRRYPALAPVRDSVLAAYETMKECYENGGTLLVAGNGGSCADSEHIGGELMKGFVKPRRVPEEFARALTQADSERGPELAAKLQGGLPAIALTGHNGLTTAFANDVDPDMVFAQQVYGYGRAGDALLALTTSGNSKNVVNAVHAARARGMRTLGITGEGESALSALCDVCLRLPARETARVQEYTLPVYHALCALIEDEFFAE